MSLGEVAEHRDYFPAADAEGLLLEENPNWKGSHMVDLRSRLWTERVIGHLIPRILQQGFHGLFLDTLDNAVYLEPREPDRFRGMSRAAERLVCKIRRHYPHAMIVMNTRGTLPIPAPNGARLIRN